ncbi:MAG: hypothetical protein HUJ30_07055 [Gammaproteobacteria bacterium]|nr:hypothetical protein [Gammaproteobacteria bacterium]
MDQVTLSGSELRMQIADKQAAPPHQQRFEVPGRPQAEIHRPESAPGRIPVPAETSAEDNGTDIIETIDQQKQGDINYQIVQKVFEHHGHSTASPTASRTQNNAQKSPAVTTESEISQHLAPEVETEVNINTLMAEGKAYIQRLEREQQEKTMPRRSDPLILDLDGDGIETSGVSNGSHFDITGDGIKEQVSFVSGGDAFLAIDKNGNGIIDSGRELFGDQLGDANGFEALKHLDSNHDQIINALDTQWQQLRLFSLNQDGSQQIRELSAENIQSIQLTYQQTAEEISESDVIAQTGNFTRDDGSESMAADILLGFRGVT